MSLIAPGGDFDEIKWEPEEEANSRKFCRRSLMVQRKSMIILREDDHQYDFAASSIEGCVRVCGCGDELFGDIRTNEEVKDKNK